MPGLSAPCVVFFPVILFFFVRAPSPLAGLSGPISAHARGEGHTPPRRPHARQRHGNERPRSSWVFFSPFWSLFINFHYFFGRAGRALSAAAVRAEPGRRAEPVPRWQRSQGGRGGSAPSGEEKETPGSRFAPLPRLRAPLGGPDEALPGARWSLRGFAPCPPRGPVLGRSLLRLGERR